MLSLSKKQWSFYLCRITKLLSIPLPYQREHLYWLKTFVSVEMTGSFSRTTLQSIMPAGQRSFSWQITSFFWTIQCVCSTWTPLIMSGGGWWGKFIEIDIILKQSMIFVKWSSSFDITFQPSFHRHLYWPCQSVFLNLFTNMAEQSTTERSC